MATKKSASKKTSSKKTSSKKTTTKKAATTKKARKATTKKKPSKRAAAKRTLEAITSAAVGCRPCVVTILRIASGREPLPQMRLNELFNVCNPGVIQALRNRFASCPNADPDAPFNCNSTVAQVVGRVCG